MKQKIPRTQQKNCVYKFDCKDCKSWYIGETWQKIEKRTYQHQNDIKNGKETNAIFIHLQQHNRHLIKWQEVSYKTGKKKNQRGPFHQHNGPKGISELRKGIWNKSMLEWIQPSGKKHCPPKRKVIRLSFPEHTHFENLHFYLTVGESCISIESDRRTSWWRHHCSVET